MGFLFYKGIVLGIGLNSKRVIIFKTQNSLVCIIISQGVVKA